MDATTTPTQDAGALPPKSAPRAIELCLSSLKDEITTLVKNEQSYQQTVQSLQSELSAYKRAYTDADADLQVAKNALHEAQALNVQLKEEASRQHDKGTRVVILIDGDGAIFSTQLISQGQKGGHAAAQQITDKVTQALVGEYGARTYQLWAYVFFNRQGLLMTFKRSGLAALNAKLDDFVAGFNQATERFIMVDVGNTKEAADAKLKVYLEAELRLTETFKVVFGGCHDNGYVANLHSQITAGFKEKLILLKSYDEMAAGIATLARELPTLTIANLFMAQKLNDAVPAAPGQRKPSPPLSGNVSLGPTEKTTLPSVAPRQLDPKLSIMPLDLLVPSLQRVHGDASTHPLHEKLERLLLTTRAVNNKYQVELPNILANNGGDGEEEETMMWFAVTHEKTDTEDTEEPWLDEEWRTKWLERIERREVQVQILLHLLKLSLPGPMPTPDTSESPRKKRRKIGNREPPPPPSLEDRLEAFMDKLSMWQLMSTLDTGLVQRRGTDDRDWMQVFCADVVEPRFGKTLPSQTALLREKVFPHSPFSDTDDADEWDPPAPPPAPAPAPAAKPKPKPQAHALSRTASSSSSSSATLNPNASRSRARSRSLSVTLAEEEQQQRQRFEADDKEKQRRVLKREVSMKRSFTPTLSVRDTAEAEKRAEEKRQEAEEEQRRKAEMVARERERVYGVTLVEATPVKARPQKIV
ncbi:hypothetical protein HMN09_01354800 [Mycena chlorophos]|uniref:DUF7923 domain-containing protein n=1 Tax=Mycena chlorophos TaxID=658473 RepID=A0A8H6VR93_MYCCL|nr:hypothetical protein HMN09_01354800 [Mycena chlorophos]